MGKIYKSELLHNRSPGRSNLDAHPIMEDPFNELERKKNVILNVQKALEQLEVDKKHLKLAQTLLRLEDCATNAKIAKLLREQRSWIDNVGLLTGAIIGAIGFWELVNASRKFLRWMGEKMIQIENDETQRQHARDFRRQ